MAYTTTNCVATQKMPGFEQQSSSDTVAKGLGIATVKPKYPQYAQIGKRYDSFQKWTNQTDVSVKALVEAGLVYTGVGDSVRCYYCGGGLKNWEDGDDPMMEHARWYPECAHVLIVCGQKFIQRAAQGLSETNLESDAPTQSILPEPEPENVLNTPACRATLEMGYTEQQVSFAVEVFKHKNGASSKLSGVALCEILMDMEDNPGLKEQYESEIAPPSDHTTLETDSSTAADDNDEDDEESIQRMIEENQRLKESQMCKICLDQTADVIFLPCGHMVSCGQCAPALTKCPICRKVVSGFVKAFFAVTKKSSTQRPGQSCAGHTQHNAPPGQATVN